MTETQVVAEPIGALIPSGHCSFPVTSDPQSSHDRCARNGGGSRANPKKVFTPCPCACHYGEEFECGGCGRPIVECLAWPFDVDGDLHYTHVDEKGWATGEECGTPARGFQKQEAEPEEEVSGLHDCEGCGLELDADDSATLCEECTAEVILPPRLGLTPEEQFERGTPAVPEDEWDDLLSEFDLDD